MSRAPEETDSRPEILTIVGPTGVGKTEVGITVAREIGGEIVSADSRQVYRGMNIGTAKPSPAELSTVRHHLIDIVEPSETYDAARFAVDAERTIGELIAAGTTPIVVGGTGFYLTSLFEGLFEGPGRNEELRAELAARAEREGLGALHDELRAVDPEAARRIHRNDTSRILRALEVYLSTGRTLSSWQADGTGRRPAYRPRHFGLTMPRESLYARIDRRVDAMIEGGLLEEVRRLHDAGRLENGMPAASAVGYRELLPIVEGETDNLDSTVEEIKRNTRRYAKRQLTWFASLADVYWIDVEVSGARGAAEAILSRWRT